MTEKWFQAYAVANKGTPQEQHDLFYFGESKTQARDRIRQAIASGFDYGYIKQGFETVAYVSSSAELRLAD